MASVAALSVKGLSPRVRGNHRSFRDYRRRRCVIGLSPRVRGNPSVCGTIRSPVIEGLSPRVRGNLERHARACIEAGSIPARAGEPAVQIQSPRTVHAARVYPRACGGTRRRGRSRARKHSPVYPRACGGTRHGPLRQDEKRSVGLTWSIPARAGEPIGVRNNSAARRLGLSPRVRGNPPLGRAPAACADGSIPARAGEPMAGANIWCGIAIGLSPRVRGNPGVDAQPGKATYGLSPRVRGNPLAGRELVNGGWGLSPRVRGNPRRVLTVLTKYRGSIPARAGEPPATCLYFGQSSTKSVYPRACGGTVPRRARTCRSMERSIPARAGEPGAKPAGRLDRGLSPRVRGNLGRQPAMRRRQRGLSPRVRGNLRVAVPASNAPSVYPRACGGTRRCAWAKGMTRMLGLSPRVRGNRSVLRCE